jgi:molybdopterin-guanine dinucleotide biosynthesis protein B
MKIISVIGYSGSGKTYIIEKIIRKLKFELSLEVGVIKYIHEHRVDEKGKDSFRFSESGAVFSIIKNKFDEIAIFLKKEINLDELITWLDQSPFNMEIIIFESFRNLPYPTILCVKEFKDVKEQFTENVKMISGLITKSEITQSEEVDLPVVDLDKDFKEFCKIFKIIELI